MNGFVDNALLVYQTKPIKLCRLNYRPHQESANEASRGAVIRRLSRTTRRASTKTLRPSTLALVYAPTEYHVLLIFAGCLKATQIELLSILAGIAQLTHRRQAGLLALSRRAKITDYLWQNICAETVSTFARKGLAHNTWSHSTLSTVRNMNSRNVLTTMKPQHTGYQPNGENWMFKPTSIPEPYVYSANSDLTGKKSGWTVCERELDVTTEKTT